MRFTVLGAATTLAVTSQAFLLPPTISPTENDVIKSLPAVQADTIEGRVMEIDCPSPSCPVVITDVEGRIHLAQVDSILRLNLTLSHNEADHLLLNGVQIYPMDLQAANFMQPLEADQLVKTTSGTWAYAASPRLAYSIIVRHPVSSANNDQLDLVAIHIEIIEVANHLVDGIPSVDVELVQTASGKLLITAAEIAPARSTASIPYADGHECTTTICKWRAIFADKLTKLKGCAGKGKPGGHGSEVKVRPHHGRPRPHGPHHHHRHHRHGRFTRLLRTIVLHVFIPIMIGVVVGVTASLIGMVVGHLVVFIWRALFRRGQRGQYTKVQQEGAASENDNDESKSFMDHQGPPPVYEDAPAYEEAVAEGNASK